MQSRLRDKMRIGTGYALTTINFRIVGIPKVAANKGLGNYRVVERRSPLKESSSKAEIVLKTLGDQLTSITSAASQR